MSSSRSIHPRNPYVTSGATKRQRTAMSQKNNFDRSSNYLHHHDRVVLLFDMDCFYAQCERVRLGLPMDVQLCLFQWNSVLAVTYPARKHGIKRGDSWEDVASKTKGKGECYTIHLPILGHDAADDADTQNKEEHGERREDVAESNDNDDSIEASYRRIFELSKEEQLRCQQIENGLRKFHTQGKASLERYRLASMRIFALVLESLRKRVTHDSGYPFVLERASIDEFYLDLTDYCYCRNRHKNYTGVDNHLDSGREDSTVVAGQKSPGQGYDNGHSTESALEVALNRATKVSRLIRQDIWRILGFTMSAGISTNKTMAKLAASYGKPNGQAVLYPSYFSNVLSETKITKVRNFGGKLGKTVLKLLLEYQRREQPQNAASESDTDALDRLKSTATMADLQQIPLPFLTQNNLLSEESARFVFLACQGIEKEEVKETSGALVKSITAFKSFTATKSHAEIFDRWLTLLATEIVDRVGRDTARNKRYPKSCTLNFTYYTTLNGQRPSGIKGSSRSHRQSRSLRLAFPSEREGTKPQKSASLLAQAKAKLVPIIKDHPLRGVGLSVSNFIESSKAIHQAPEGTASIQSFFSKSTAVSTSTSKVTSPLCPPKQGVYEAEKAADKISLAITKPANDSGTAQTGRDIFPLSSSSINNPVQETVSAAFANSRLDIHKHAETLEDKDLDYARKLQASFDRENYALTTANRRQKSNSDCKKTRRIDAFFKKK